MNLKSIVFTIILTTAACISSSAATDSLSTVTDNRKDSKLVRFLSEKVSVSGYAQAGYQYDTYDMTHDGAFNKFNLYRAMIIADIKPIKHLDLYFMADVSKFKLHELYVRYRPVDAFYIRLGQYKTPFTIESNMSPSVLEIIKGAQAVQYLAGIDGSDACFGGGAGRDSRSGSRRRISENRKGQPQSDRIQGRHLQRRTVQHGRDQQPEGRGGKPGSQTDEHTQTARFSLYRGRDGTGGQPLWKFQGRGDIPEGQMERRTGTEGRGRCISGANTWKVSTHPSGAEAHTPH